MMTIIAIKYSNNNKAIKAVVIRIRLRIMITVGQNNKNRN